MDIAWFSTMIGQDIVESFADDMQLLPGNRFQPDFHPFLGKGPVLKSDDFRIHIGTILRGLVKDLVLFMQLKFTPNLPENR